MVGTAYCIALACIIFSEMMMLISSEKTLSRVRRYIWPPASGMGIFLAIAVPVDLPQYELSLSYNFEANYALPDNATELELPPPYTQIRYARSLTRSRMYSVIEDRLNQEGFIGRACLLRTICETSATPLGDHNGLLGDLLHLVFTPSTSQHEGLASEFYNAEECGRINGTDGCETNYSECPINLFSLFSTWGGED